MTDEPPEKPSGALPDRASQYVGPTPPPAENRSKVHTARIKIGGGIAPDDFRVSEAELLVVRDLADRSGPDDATFISEAKARTQSRWRYATLLLVTIALAAAAYAALTWQ